MGKDLMTFIYPSLMILGNLICELSRIPRANFVEESTGKGEG